MSGNRAKLVRAKVKEPKYWPDWAQCCNGAIDRRLAWGEMTVDPSRTYIADGSGDLGKTCATCGAIFPKGTKGILELKTDRYVPIELLDLDEGLASL